MDTIQAISLGMGSAWASGINLYATIFMLGFLQLTGNINLPPEMRLCADPLVLVAAGFMYCVEFFADKIPGVDSAWDALHSFIRIPAGALLAAGAVGQLAPGAELAGALLGGTVAAASHATKAGTRVLINTSPEPFTNWTASVGEDILAVGGLWTALHYPWAFLAGLVVFILLVAWLLPKLWRGVKAVFRTLGRWLGLSKPVPAASVAPSPPASPGAPADDPTQRLAQLDQMLAQGQLSPPEHQTLRQRVLDQISPPPPPEG